MNNTTGYQGWHPNSLAMGLQFGNTTGSQGLQPTSSNMAVHANRVRGLRQSMTFPQTSGSQQDLISLAEDPFPREPVQATTWLEAAATEASPASFAGMDLGADAVVHDNPLSEAVDMSPTPILPRLHIPRGSSGAQEAMPQVGACMCITLWLC